MSLVPSSRRCLSLVGEKQREDRALKLFPTLRFCEVGGEVQRLISAAPVATSRDQTWKHCCRGEEMSRFLSGVRDFEKGDGGRRGGGSHGSVYFKGYRTGFFRQPVIKVYSRQHGNSDINVWLITDILTVFECSKSTSISKEENIEVSWGDGGGSLSLRSSSVPRYI